MNASVCTWIFMLVNNSVIMYKNSCINCNMKWKCTVTLFLLMVEMLVCIYILIIINTVNIFCRDLAYKMLQVLKCLFIFAWHIDI